MKLFRLFWSPKGRQIATVKARTMRAAIRKAPMPYRRYLGEIYATEVVPGYESPSAQLLQNVMRKVADRNPGAPTFTEQTT
jgi:hypothetical protein